MHLLIFATNRLLIYKIKTMEKKFNFVYIITNLITRQQYIGDHSTNNLNDKYLGSGRPYLQNAFREYGKENFKKEILEFFPTKQEAFDAQEKYIIKHNTLVPNGYNISPKGGHNNRGCWSEESKKKCSLTKQGSLGYYKDKHLSEEHKKHISDACKGINKGHKCTEETKEKIRKTLQKLPKRQLSDNHKENLRKAAIGHSNQKGEKNSMYGKRWIINSITLETKLIKVENLNDYILKEWKQGKKL